MSQLRKSELAKGSAPTYEWKVYFRFITRGSSIRDSGITINSFFFTVSDRTDIWTFLVEHQHQYNDQDQYQKSDPRPPGTQHPSLIQTRQSEWVSYLVSEWVSEWVSDDNWSDMSITNYAKTYLYFVPKNSVKDFKPKLRIKFSHLTSG